MNAGHRIRLAGPWSLIVNRGTPDEFVVPLRFPATWPAMPGRTSDRAHLTRVFKKPTGLSPEHQVLLCVDHNRSVQECVLNDVPLSMEEPYHQQNSFVSLGKWDVLEYLQKSNLLLLTLAVPKLVTPFSIMAMEVWLEIQEPNQGVADAT
ncbi:MAG: hypothetical protein O2931_01375 [Planctomycetota bacterium]|nr:hypothetical protein [Planctomycetota bacterium]MDA1177424.1 hypothetical protein [Planctomycetota bacterium]